MKRLIFGLAFAMLSRGQLLPPLPNLLEFPKLVNPTSERPVHTLALVPPSSLELTFKLNPSAVCSVPLLDAHADKNDPGIAIKPGGQAVAIPQANVPAPACQNK